MRRIRPFLRIFGEKVERNFRTVRSRFLASLPECPTRTLEELNDLLAAYIARHNGTPHSALGGKTPLQAWEGLTASAPLRQPKGADWLDECFRNRARRKVGRDATIRVDNVLYDVSQHLCGRSVEVAYTPGDQEDVWVVDELGRRTRVRPTDREANSRMPREAPRYRYDYGEGGGGR